MLLIIASIVHIHKSYAGKQENTVTRIMFRLAIMFLIYQITIIKLFLSYNLIFDSTQILCSGLQYKVNGIFSR